MNTKPILILIYPTFELNPKFYHQAKIALN